MIKKKILQIYKNLKFDKSSNYWDNRYKQKGNSGAGSYGRLAEFKAEILNDFIDKNNIKDIIEFGCGDGNQLKMIKINQYIGLDVSEKMISELIQEFKKDSAKSFFLYSPFRYLDNSKKLSCDLSLSLDVIYHLIEDNVLHKYLYDLFNASNKYVIIYASNYDSEQLGHVKHRNFTKIVEKKFPDFKLIKTIKNKYPFDEKNPKNTSFADFYIYKKNEENK